MRTPLARFIVDVIRRGRANKKDVTNTIFINGVKFTVSFSAGKTSFVGPFFSPTIVQIPPSVTVLTSRFKIAYADLESRSASVRTGVFSGFKGTGVVRAAFESLGFTVKETRMPPTYKRATSHLSAWDYANF
jgi:hypothetical protein